ncbi:hypothetical protein [Rhizobium subbaraonis]|uniref:hypothetical protein n=1 Tax=Rhizobium subbaraonis TaxID=908946 RepID=UPI0011434419|nr:hypothetical protein [Rhizobium subbaraonis]
MGVFYSGRRLHARRKMMIRQIFSGAVDEWDLGCRAAGAHPQGRWQMPLPLCRNVDDEMQPDVGGAMERQSARNLPEIVYANDGQKEQANFSRKGGTP